jgi:hypothetical protein
MKRHIISSSLIFVLGACGTTMSAEEVPAPTTVQFITLAPVTTTTTTTTPTTTTTTTTTTTVPPTTTTQAPEYKRTHPSCAYENLIRQKFENAGATRDEQTRAVNIVYRESRCFPEVSNKSERTRDYSIGLAQINLRKEAWGQKAADLGYTEELLYNPEHNINFMVRIWRMCRGFGPWTKPYSCGG